MPDLEDAIAQPYADDPVEVWLVAVEDPFELTWSWVGEAGVTLPVLQDHDGAAYGAYSDEEAGEPDPPFPLHVVVDGDGVIRYLSRENTPDQVRDAIDQALEALAR